VSDRTYTLEMPEMTLAFGLPPQTSLAPSRLADDWRAFLSRVLEVALGVNVQDWDRWDSDVTYTTNTGSGFAVASGTVRLALDDNGVRRLVEVSQEQLEEQLSDYFLIWGVDDMWEFMISRGYPMTNIVLQVADQNLSPRRASPEALEELLQQQEEGADDKRNAWIAGVVCGVLVLVVAAVVAFLYLQRQGQPSDKAWGTSSSPKTQTSDPTSPARRPLAPPSMVSSSDVEVVLRERLDAASEDISSAPGWSESMLESSFLYDAARLDHVIDSAREYELPYPVANVPFSDLTGTSGVKDAAQQANKRGEEEDVEDEEEDLMILAAEEGAFGSSINGSTSKKADEAANPMEQDAVTDKKSERVASPIDLNYSRSLFDVDDDDEEKKEAEGPADV
jgi:hypothetical protein